MHTIQTVTVQDSEMEVFLFMPQGEGPHPGLIATIGRSRIWLLRTTCWPGGTTCMGTASALLVIAGAAGYPGSVLVTTRNWQLV